MPKRSKLKLTPVDMGKEALGERIARLRKERALTQNDMVERTGLTQVLVSDYERGRLRISAEMAVRFAEALGVTTDELLRPTKKKKTRARHPASSPASDCFAVWSRSKAGRFISSGHCSPLSITFSPAFPVSSVLHSEGLACAFLCCRHLTL
jgi:transcriptional regulator with XRE-family HTH domain